MSDATGFYDRSNIPIHVGDLIRVGHYRHCRNRRTMYLYFRVAVHPKLPNSEYCRYVLQNWNDLDPMKWQCLLRDCGLATCEVLAESDLRRDKHGQVITFNERKQKQTHLRESE